MKNLEIIRPREASNTLIPCKTYLSTTVMCHERQCEPNAKCPLSSPLLSNPPLWFSDKICAWFFWNHCCCCTSLQSISVRNAMTIYHSLCTNNPLTKMRTAICDSTAEMLLKRYNKSLIYCIYMNNIPNIYRGINMYVLCSGNHDFFAVLFQISWHILYGDQWPEMAVSQKDSIVLESKSKSIGTFVYSPRSWPNNNIELALAVHRASIKFFQSADRKIQ